MSDAEDRQACLALARTQAIAPPVMAHLEEIFRHPKQMLGGIERQRRFLATTFLPARECPWCDSAVGYFEAIPAALAPAYTIDNLCEEHRCPHCDKRLKKIVPFMGPWFWAKHEADKNPDRKKVKAL